MAKICLACRNNDRAAAAKADLEWVMGRSIFDMVFASAEVPIEEVRRQLGLLPKGNDALAAGPCPPSTPTRSSVVRIEVPAPGGSFAERLSPGAGQIGLSNFVELKGLEPSATVGPW